MCKDVYDMYNAMYADMRRQIRGNMYNDRYNLMQSMLDDH